MLNNRIFYSHKTTKHTLRHTPNSHSIANSIPQASGVAGNVLWVGGGTPGGLGGMKGGSRDSLLKQFG